MVKILIYTRVSTKSQAQHDRNGLKTQEHHIRKYIESSGQKCSISVRQFIGSAMNMNESEVEFFETLKDTSVIVFSCSRFSRNVEESKNLLKIMHSNDSNVFSVSEKVMSDFDHSKFIEYIKCAQDYVRLCSKMSKAAHQRKVDKKLYTRQCPPGFQRVYIKGQPQIKIVDKQMAEKLLTAYFSIPPMFNISWPLYKMNIRGFEKWSKMRFKTLQRQLHDLLNCSNFEYNIKKDKFVDWNIYYYGIFDASSKNLEYGYSIPIKLENVNQINSFINILKTFDKKVIIFLTDTEIGYNIVQKYCVRNKEGEASLNKIQKLFSIKNYVELYNYGKITIRIDKNRNI